MDGRVAEVSGHSRSSTVVQMCFASESGHAEEVAVAAGGFDLKIKKRPIPVLWTALG